MAITEPQKVVCEKHIMAFGYMHLEGCVTLPGVHAANSGSFRGKTTDSKYARLVTFLRTSPFNTSYNAGFAIKWIQTACYLSEPLFKKVH